METEFLQRLMQADLRLFEPKEAAKLPMVLVPIRGEKLSAGEIKYILHRYGTRNGLPCFRMQAAKDFITPGQKRVCKGEWGGVVDSLAFVAQKDASWVENGSFAYHSAVSEDTLVSAQSTVLESEVRHSMIEKSQILQSRINDSTIQNSEILDHCTIVNSDVVNCRLFDRVWLEKVSAQSSSLFFTAADNSVIYFEKLRGDAENVRQLNLHDYHSPKFQKAKAENKPKGFWQRLWRGDFER